MSTDRRGKAVVRSSDWSDWVWDDRQYWYRYRVGLGGKYEYEYRDASPEKYAVEKDYSERRYDNKNGREGEYKMEAAIPMQHAPESSYMRLRRSSDCSLREPLESSYTTSNSVRYPYLTQPKPTWPIQTSSKSAWMSNGSPEDLPEPQEARASTWPLSKASRMTPSSPPSILATGSKLLQAVTPRPLLKKRIIRRPFVPKAIKILANSREYFARPDTGSDRNIMSYAQAKEHGITIRKHSKDEKIRLGTGTYARSLGKAHMSISIPDVGFEKSVSFYVLEKCTNPIILGSKFIQDIELYTKNRHLLVECLDFVRRHSILNRMGRLTLRIPLSADGYSLMACPDTGSDLDFISEECVIRCGFEINASDDVRQRIMLGDTSIVETLGEVNIRSIELKGHESFSHTFHVLRGLPCDAIFGAEFLEDLDAWYTCDIIIGEEESSTLQVNLYTNLGSVAAFAARAIWRHPAPRETELEEHDRLKNEEWYRQNRADREIPFIRDETVRRIAEAEERARRVTFENLHSRCDYCSVRRR